MRNQDDETNSGRFGVPRAAWLTLALTFGLMMSDYVSRQVLIAVFPFLRSSWGLSDTELGSLVSIVALMVGCLSLPISFAADRLGRVRGIAVMGAVWSLATIGCGLATSYGQLFAARTVIGIGEAAYATAGGAILMHAFPPRLRSTVMGLFAAGALFGSVLGVSVGGVVAERFGWRWAFISVGIPGLILALIYPLFVRDYETVKLVKIGEKGLLQETMSWIDMVRASLGVRATILAYIGGGLQLFGAATVMAWIPSYLNRVHGFSPEPAAIYGSLILLLGGVGMAFGGYLADRLAARHIRGVMFVPAGFSIVCGLLFTALLSIPAGDAQFALIFVGGFFIAGHVGAVSSVAAELNHPGLRATALAVVAVVYNLIGLAPGPFVVGALSDAYGLETAMFAIPIACMFAAAFFLLSARELPKAWLRAHSRSTIDE